MTHGSLTIHNMSPACGGIVEGVDLSRELSSRQFDQIHDALLDRTVLVFRDQDLTKDQQVAFSRWFGDPQPSDISGFEKDHEHPEIDLLEYDADNPPHTTLDLWHTDFAGREKPTMGTTLYAKDIPPEGRHHLGKFRCRL